MENSKTKLKRENKFSQYLVFFLIIFLDDGEADEQKGFNDEVKRNYKMNKKDEEAFEAFMNNSGL